MAIIYTYPEESPITGKELVVVSSDNDEKSTRNVTLQEIANINGTNPGVSRVYFADSLGLSPSTSEAGADPTAGTGLVQVTGTVLAIGGGTGKDSTALTAANVGDVLVVNSSKDGFDFSTASSGETYDLGTLQNTTTPTNVDLTLTGSSTSATTVTLVPGDSGNVTLTADTTVTPPTITIESSGGGTGTTYQEGNGINIDTATSPDTLSVAIGTSAGLGFNSSSQLVTSLIPNNIAATGSATNGSVLTYNGSASMSWVQPTFSPTVVDNEDLSLIYMDPSNYSPTTHTGVTNVKGAVTKISNVSPGGSAFLQTITFELQFQVGATSTLRSSGYSLGIAKASRAALFENGPQHMYSGSIGIASVLTSSADISTAGFATQPVSCIVLSKTDPGVSTSNWLVANDLGEAANTDCQKYIWIGGHNNNSGSLNMIRYTPPSTSWIASGVSTSDIVYLSGTLTAYGQMTDP